MIKHTGNTILISGMVTLRTSIKIQTGHRKLDVKFVRDYDVLNTPVEAEINQGSL